MSNRKAYPSDLTDEQWELIEVILPDDELPKPKGGRPREVDLREVINAILFQVRSGCQWDMLPHDLPPKSTVYRYFARWRDDGTLDHINKVLVGAVRQLEAPSEHMDPSTASVDSQTVPTAPRCDSRGYDGGKRITGRKRNIVVDSLGLLLAVVVTVASTDDAQAGRQALSQLDEASQPRLKTIWADSKYHNHALRAWLAKRDDLKWELQVVRRPKGAKGFVLLPRRWVVERTFGWFGWWRRLSKDYEHRADSAEAMVKWASVGRMLRRLSPSPTQAPFKYRVT